MYFSGTCSVFFRHVFCNFRHMLYIFQAFVFVFFRHFLLLFFQTHIFRHIFCIFKHISYIYQAHVWYFSGTHFVYFRHVLYLTCFILFGHTFCIFQAIMFIKNYRTVSLVPCNGNRWILLFDSHPHGYRGLAYGSYLFYCQKNEDAIRELFNSYEYFCDSYKFYGQFAIFEVT